MSNKQQNEIIVNQHGKVDTGISPKEFDRLLAEYTQNWDKERAQLQAENALLKERAKSSTLGSAVLLRNKDIKKDTFTLHGNINVNRELWNTIGQDLDNSLTDEAQLDFSMNQSKWMKHDRLDPIEVLNAPAFWVEESSEFCVETFTQHKERDPDSAYDMFALPGDRDVSVGVRNRKVA